LKELVDEGAFNFSTGYSTAKGKEMGLPDYVFVAAGYVPNSPWTQGLSNEYFLNRLSWDARYSLMPEALKDCVLPTGEIIDYEKFYQVVTQICQDMTGWTGVLYLFDHYNNVRGYYWHVNSGALRSFYPWMNGEMIDLVKREADRIWESEGKPRSKNPSLAK
jgi:hypothetical protein